LIFEIGTKGWIREEKIPSLEKNYLKKGKVPIDGFRIVTSDGKDGNRTGWNY
jgi:hypothetical protein